MTRNMYLSEVKRIRTELVSTLGLSHMQDIELILTTSGTDAELFALFLAICRYDQPVMNILVGPEETGSGVVLAAQGLHFAENTPLGKPASKREPVEGLPTDQVKLVEVPIRDSTGAYLSCSIVDERVKALINKAIADGCRVLLHLVDNSKTG